MTRSLRSQANGLAVVPLDGEHEAVNQILGMGGRDLQRLRLSWSEVLTRLTGWT